MRFIALIMSSIIYGVIATVLWCGVVPLAQAQTSEMSGGTISGRLTLDGKPASGIYISVVRLNESSKEKNIPKVVTDEEGWFSINNLPLGTYEVVPFAPSYTKNGIRNESWQFVHLSDQERAKEFDIALIRGGVITGKITDSQGHPVIGQPVTLHIFGFDGKPFPLSRHFLHDRSSLSRTTDDHGIYRFYGLPPRKYMVSVGEGYQRDVSMGYGSSRDPHEGATNSTYYARTFYPGTNDETKAEVLELSSGSELNNIDIKLGRLLPKYRVSGRIIKADTGEPLPNTRCDFGFTDENDLARHTTSITSNSKGEFSIDNLLPG
ncbi:MAG: hypothetical protein AB1489_14875, partial [Acidobacteriota bacterium]